jgi:capsule biosynthesis phosphatase
MKTLVIDLDHTICKPIPDEDQSSDKNLKYSNAKPDLEVIDRLLQYRSDGFKIVVHTSRNMRTYDGDVQAIKINTLPIIIEWLDRHSVPYDDIVVGKPWCGFDGFYVDDRAIRPSEFRHLSRGEIGEILAQERCA